MHAALKSSCRCMHDETHESLTQNAQTAGAVNTADEAVHSHQLVLPLWLGPPYRQICQNKFRAANSRAGIKGLQQGSGASSMWDLSVPAGAGDG